MFIRCKFFTCMLLAIYVGALNQPIDSGCGHVRRRRLVGGREDNNCERPYAVFLRFGSQQCSGAIVSVTTELTSARCYEGDVRPNDSFAFAGNVWYKHEEDFNSPTQVRKLTLCRRYNALQIEEYDIMICRNYAPWVFDLFVSAVEIFFFSNQLRPRFKLQCDVVGFGRVNNELEAGYMHSYEQVMETWRKCRKVRSEQFMCTVDTKDKTMCAGDEGGPVTCMFRGRRLLFGLLSTYSHPQSVGCQAPIDWNLASFLGHYQEWLKFNIPDLPSCEPLPGESFVNEISKLTSTDTIYLCSAHTKSNCAYCSNPKKQQRAQLTTSVTQSITIALQQNRRRDPPEIISTHSCLATIMEKLQPVTQETQKNAYIKPSPRKRLHSETTSVYSTLPITKNNDQSTTLEYQNVTQNRTMLKTVLNTEKSCNCVPITTSDETMWAVSPSSQNFTCPCVTAALSPRDACNCPGKVAGRRWLPKESDFSKKNSPDAAILVLSVSIVISLCHSENVGFLLASITFILENKDLHVQYMCDFYFP